MPCRRRARIKASATPSATPPAAPATVSAVMTAIAAGAYCPDPDCNQHAAIKRDGNGIVEERLAFDDRGQRAGTFKRRKTATTAIGSVALRIAAGQERGAERHANDRERSRDDCGREQHARSGERRDCDPLPAHCPNVQVPRCLEKQRREERRTAWRGRARTPIVPARSVRRERRGRRRRGSATASRAL